MSYSLTDTYPIFLWLTSMKELTKSLPYIMVSLLVSIRGYVSRLVYIPSTHVFENMRSLFLELVYATGNSKY
jgi:hypothetical protein